MAELFGHTCFLFHCLSDGFVIKMCIKNVGIVEKIMYNYNIINTIK